MTSKPETPEKPEGQSVSTAGIPTRFTSEDRPQGGRPPKQAAPTDSAGLHALLWALLDSDTVTGAMVALRRKLRRGSIPTWEFVLDRLIGKPAVTVEHGLSDGLQQFLQAWQDGSQDEAPTIEGAYSLLLEDGDDDEDEE